MGNATLRKHLEAYESMPEEWHHEHDYAMMCHDVRDSLAVGLLILDLLNKVDESLRLDAFTNTTRIDSTEVFQQIEELYDKWLTASLAHLEVVATLQRQGYSVEGLDRFRGAVADVQKMMTPDKEFFSGAKLADLRDDAIEANARGETEEWGQLH